MLKKRESEVDDRVPFLDVALRIGRAVQAQVNLLKLRQRVASENKRREELNNYVSQLKDGHSKNVPEPPKLTDWEKKLIQRSLDLEKKIQLIQNRWKAKNISVRDITSRQWTLQKDQCKWSEGVMAQIGALLFDAFKEVGKIQIEKTSGKIMGQLATISPQYEPILKHEIIWQKRYSTSVAKFKRGVVSIHPAVLKAIEAAEMHVTAFMTRTQPMVCPPVDWRSYDVGGYLWTPSRVIRSYENTEPMKLVKEADQEGRLHRIYHALSVLGKTPWMMNQEILTVVEEVWKQGGGKLELPSKTNVDIPPEPHHNYRIWGENGVLYANFAGETLQESYFRGLDVARTKKKNAELHSLRCDVELKLAVARKFLAEDRIYFPHNIDFRGRAYPIPPHLNHLGNDMCRGLLQFAEARPLGKEGLDWLYIQIANLYGAGENKKKLTERRKFGETNMDNIMDSAEKPLTGLQWWIQADSPWQLLATCMEIRDAINSGNPETYHGRMHVHQDGSCNGLQHYAALGRDAAGATAVNLRPADAPNDVYSEVSRIVERIVREDAEKGNRLAKTLQGHVDRKLVKQTVMTSVYGVTFIGARDQIANRLRERGWEDDSTLFQASAYAAKVTMVGLHEQFHNAKDVMRWLAECAKVIATAGQSVKWTTPLGLTIGQPYRDKETCYVKTVLQDICLVRNRLDLPVIKRRQQTAFPPNYVHSLDSSHMMMTAVGCHEKQITFAGVHDSFWTHAGTVTEMNRILREKFYELHSQPLLEQLLTEFKKTFAEQKITFPELPQLGDFDVREITDAPYFFS